MQKIKMALCDVDKVYCERFAAYMMNQKAREIELYIYSETGQLPGAEKMRTFDLVLAGSGFEELSSETNTLYLSDVCGTQTAENRGQGEKIMIHPKTVSKYQPMEQLLHEIYVQTGRVKKERETEFAGKLEVYGVFSPGGHEMQELFSVMHAQNLSRDKKVLYLNFLEFSGFRELFEQTGEYDIADVILQLRRGKMDVEYLRNCVYEIAGISVILPFENPENMKQTDSKELENLITFIGGNTDFEILIIDFGMSMQKLLNCLKLCEKVFLLGKEGFFYECRENQFYRWIEKTGEENLREKIQRIFVPYSAKSIRGGGNVLEQLQWSEFGDFVRKFREHPATPESHAEDLALD